MRCSNCGIDTPRRALRVCSTSTAAVPKRAMLAEIYNWFTEGFDTAGLRDAKALLEELGKP